MTTEEKAKAYDMALEGARKELGVDRKEWEVVQRVLRNIFPELKESEDEIHRKWILEYLYDGLRKADEQFKDHFRSAIAWLEKQKESLHIPETCKENADSFTDEKDRNIRGCIGMALADVSESRFKIYGVTLKECLAYLEKQKEQKPSDLPAGFYFIDQDGNKYYSKEFSYNNGTFTTTMKVKEEQKPNHNTLPIEQQMEAAMIAIRREMPSKSQEWNEEDEKMNKEIRLYLKQDRTEFPERADRINKMIEWLVNIYPQPQPNMSISFMLYLDEIRQEGKMCLSNGECADIEDAFNKQDWPRLFKYINKYRPSWKPSEEQMTALDGCLEHWTGNKHQKEFLESLYEDLKKL